MANDCDAAANENEGCGVKAPATNSYGPSFNSAGGGWYAMERTDSFFKIWFWPRTDWNVPLDVLAGTPLIDTDAWVCCKFSLLTNLLKLNI